MAMKTYFDFAENDFRYFMDSHARGVVANAMAADAQEICEKYMKHLLNEYFDPETPEQDADYSTVMRTHNLIKISRFMEEALDFQLSSGTKSELRQINGYYFTARYPGDESIEVEKEDLELCASAVTHCRAEIMAEIAKLESQRKNENK